jgi:O-antigen/teichoic acid export membrane protein
MVPAKVGSSRHGAVGFGMKTGRGPETGEPDFTQDTGSTDSRNNVVSIARGGGYLAGGTLFDFASRFVIGVLLARLLGPADYGLYQLAISAGAIFAGVSALGLDDAMVRYVAIQRGRKDDPGVWGTIQIGLGIAMPMAVLLGGSLYLAAPLVANGLFDEPALTPALRLMSAVIPVLTLSNVLLGITRGTGRMDHAAFGENVVQSLVRMVLLASLALVGLDLYAALIIFAISDLASSITLGVLINRSIPLRPSAHDEVRRDVRSVFGFALPLWVSGVINQFQRNISIFVLGAAASPASVGIFAIVGHVTMVGHAVYRAVIVAVKPLLAQLHDRGDRRSLSHIYTTTTRWLLMANIPFFLALVLYPSSILAIFGEAYQAGAAALIVMAFAELVNSGTGICGSLIDMTGHTRIKVVNSVLWLLVLGVANVLLVPSYGVLGAAIAYLISITVVNLARMVELWVLERVFPSWLAYVKPVFAGLVSVGCGVGLKALVPVGSAFLPALVQGLAVLVVYVATLLLLGLDDDDRDILRRIRRKTGRALPGRA